MNDYKLIKLKNGIRLVLIPQQSTKVLTIMTMFAVGSKNESDEIAGISHVLEHMHYKGTKKRPTAFEIAEFIESIGGEHNAFTGKEITGYYVKIAPKHLAAGLEFLSDILLESEFNPLELEKEKDVIIQEVKMYEDLPMEMVGNNFEKALFGDNALGRDVIGYKKSIKDVTREKLFDYKKQFYHGSNMSLVLAGNIDDYTEEELVSLAEKFFPVPAGTKEVAKVENINDKKKFDISLKDTEQSHLIVGFRTVSFNDPDYIKIELLGTILGGSMSSRMFEEIREKRGLAYSVKTYTANYLESGMLFTQAGVEHEKTYETAEAIINEYKRIKRERISESELNKAKEILLGRLLIKFEDSEEVANHYAWEVLIPDQLRTPEDLAKEYQKISIDDIFEMANKYFTDERLGAAFVGKVCEKEKLEKILNI